MELRVPVELVVQIAGARLQRRRVCQDLDVKARSISKDFQTLSGETEREPCPFADRGERWFISEGELAEPCPVAAGLGGERRFMSEDASELAEEQALWRRGMLCRSGT